MFLDTPKATPAPYFIKRKNPDFSFRKSGFFHMKEVRQSRRPSFLGWEARVSLAECSSIAKRSDAIDEAFSLIKAKKAGIEALLSFYSV